MVAPVGRGATARDDAHACTVCLKCKLRITALAIWTSRLKNDFCNVTLTSDDALNRRE